MSATKIAFNTANLVARFTDWRFELKNWGEQDRITRERTDERAWAAICKEITDAGFRAVEVWAAHVDPQKITEERAGRFKQIMTEHRLEPVGLSGTPKGQTP